MTNEEINIAIAEACGWTWVSNGFGARYLAAPGVIGFGPDETSALCTDWADGVPDYCNDLNAMHEVEKAIRCADDQFRYAAHLLKINKQGWLLEAHDLNVDYVWIGTTATASQRAEAYLRTIGKWKEGEML